MKVAQKLDPTGEFTNMVSVHILYLARQYDQAIEQAKSALEYSPESWGTYFWLAAAYERKGMYDQAIEAYLKSSSLQGTKPDSLEVLKKAYQKDGIRGFWRRERAILQVGDLEMCSIRSIYAQFDNRERTLEYLNQSIDQHCGNIRTLKVDPFYDGLRKDPEFKEVLVRLHLN